MKRYQESEKGDVDYHVALLALSVSLVDNLVPLAALWCRGRRERLEVFVYKERLGVVLGVSWI